jgi:hypothetical protein
VVDRDEIASIQEPRESVCIADTRTVDSTRRYAATAISALLVVYLLVQPAIVERITGVGCLVVFLYGLMITLQPASAVEVDSEGITVALFHRRGAVGVRFDWDEIASVTATELHRYRFRIPVLQIKVRDAKAALARFSSPSDRARRRLVGFGRSNVLVEMQAGQLTSSIKDAHREIERVSRRRWP